MGKSRIEAFSDGVIAIIITIMVLELKVPAGPTLADLRPLLPIFLSYILSFLYVGIYWNNHHHLIHAVKVVTGTILWANLHLLFWLSLLPFATAWLGESWLSEHHASPVPSIVYGGDLLMAGMAYYLLQQLVLAEHSDGSKLAAEFRADWKGRLSPVAYVAAIGFAFVHPWISYAVYSVVALWWVIPDRRIERALH